MRTIRSNLFQDDHSCSLTQSATEKSGFLSENLTDSVIDMRLGELASRNNKSVKSSCTEEELLDLSQAFSDFSACSSDTSGELQRLACLPSPENAHRNNNGEVELEKEAEPEPCLGFLQRENFSTEIIESISPEDLQPTVKICIGGLQSSSVAVKRSAAAKLRLLAKNRADNCVLIAESGAVPALVPLLRCNDPWTQEHAVTALLNLSLHEDNKLLTNFTTITSRKKNACNKCLNKAPSRRAATFELMHAESLVLATSSELRTRVLDNTPTIFFIAGFFNLV